MALHDFDEQRQYGYPVCATCGLSRTAHDEEQRIAAARREGVIEGLEIALGLFPKPNSMTQWDPQDAIRAKIERLRGES